MNTYCEIARGHAVHERYHDEEYGFPLHDDDLLFERLVLEINQAGLSWLTVLRKRQALRDAYAAFVIAKVARFDSRRRAKLMEDTAIIRNRMKIDAAIENAKRIRSLQRTHGSFDAWLAAHHPRDRKGWVALFKATFVFTGGEITGEFLMSTGYLPGAHAETCPVYPRVIAAGAAWSGQR